MPIFPSFFVNKTGGYEIEQSLRFDGSNRLDFASPTSETVSALTVSCWVKVCVNSTNGATILDRQGAPNTATRAWLIYNAFGSNKFDSYYYTSSINGRGLLSSQSQHRDPSAWQHVVFSFDNTAGQYSQKIFINGVDLTDNFSEATNGVVGFEFSSTYPPTIGWNDGEMYLAEYHLISGSQVDYDEFGEFDANGVWRPIEYTGSYGTNGFYLKFDPTATNGIGHDHSGNDNHLTANSFTTSGTGTDVMSDTPTKNWATLNTAIRQYSSSIEAISDGNLKIANTGSGVTGSGWATIAVDGSGKWYFEATPSVATGSIWIGFGDNADKAGLGTNSAALRDNGYTYKSNGNKCSDSSTGVSYGASYGVGDIIGVALDLEDDEITFYKNGASQGTAFTSIFSTGGFFAGCSVDPSATVELNFGQREFAYPPGTVSATDYFNTVLYTGTGSSLAVTGVGFQPDLVWIKNRGRSGSDSCIVDVVRGATKSLSSDNANAEITFNGTDDFVSFDSDGFSLGTSSNLFVNSSSDTHVAFCWKAGGTASANTDGDIDSSVSASTDAGFSVFTYTGNGGTDQTVGHGLGVTPSFCIVKSRASNSWFIRHNSLGSNENFNFNSSGAVTPGGGGLIGDLSSTSTITLKSGSNNADNINANGTNYVAYCWADKDGVTKTGSYTGTGTQGGGLYVECGFKPAMVIVKGDATASWQIIDNKRGDDVAYFPDSDGTENERSDRQILFVQNGFLVQGNDGNINSSGVDYYFTAFASNLAVDEDYKALNTANLPAPDIKDGSDYFGTALYAGSLATAATVGATQDVTGLNTALTPDMVWIKNRGSGRHVIFDVLRLDSDGDNALRVDTTDAEAANVRGGVSSLNAGGFTAIAGSDSSDNTGVTCQTGNNYVAWAWASGGSGSSNTDGSITSTVSANASAGFSIVGYTGVAGDNISATVGHGLGVAPDLIIIKNRDWASSGAAWQTYHSALPSTGSSPVRLSQSLSLDTTDAASGNDFKDQMNNTLPTSTVFSVSSHDGVSAANRYRTYGRADDYIAYCFAEVEGYSKFGSYTGNGSSTDGPFIYTGFAVSWVMCKRTDSSTAGNWVMWDNERNPYNESANYLLANTSDAEGSSGTQIDLLSNGFKPRSVGGCNTSGASYIFAAFAENPFGGDGVSPATAR